MRAAIYVRISQDRTGEELGVTRQLEDCTKLVESLGWTVAEVYRDNDTSATSRKPRPEYRRLLRDTDAGLVDAIVSWAPDRLYRRLADLEELIPIVEKHNVLIRTVKAGEFDLSTGLGKMIARILGTVATGEGDIKVERWKRSIQQRREEGRMPGSGPRMLGWTRTGEIVPEEAAAIRWLAEQVLDGTSVNRLAHVAEERGIRSSKGYVMSKQTLKQLLRNPRLAGFATLNGEIVGRGTWTPILDLETWEAVRTALTAHPTRATPPRVALLPGLVFCGAPTDDGETCGAPMVTGHRVTKRKEMARTYRCIRDVGRGGCGKLSIRATHVEEMVEGYAQRRFAVPQVRAQVEQLRAGSSERAVELGQIELRIQELEAELDRPGVPVSSISRAIERARARQDELLAVSVHGPVVRLPEGDSWPEDLSQRRALVNLVVERVTITPATKRGAVFEPERVQIRRRDLV